jgi:hypothetical protein
VSLIRRGIAFVLMLLGISVMCIDARAQSAVDTMRLNIVPPDSVYLRRDGQNIVVGWYPSLARTGSIAGSSIAGSRHWTNWRGPDANISQVTISGNYVGIVDLTLNVGRIVLTNVTVDTVGVEPSIRMYAEVRDRYDTYYKEFNLGASYYTIPPGDTVGPPIPLNLIGLAMGDTLRLGIALAFSAGIIDSTILGGPASFEVDLQTLEGFHIWRGLSPIPTNMSVISEFSLEDAYIGVFKDDVRNYSIRVDAYGRPYWEYVDMNAFAGFTYYYIVTSFDRGYFKGMTQFNKKDNFICDEDLSNPADTLNPVPCEGVSKIITMTVDTGTDMRAIFAVPNPYRTGTSAETQPFYHNYPDGSIKFFNVPKEADMKIYTVSGDLIWEAHHSSSDGILSWDVKNRLDVEVGSGVYIYRCKNSVDGSDQYGKVIVIR